MIDKAITFATKAHEGQFRKGTKLPYIVHPLEVGVIVSRMTQDKEVIAAAILHDTLEDCKEVTFSTGGDLRLGVFSRGVLRLGGRSRLLG